LGETRFRKALTSDSCRWPRAPVTQHLLVGLQDVAELARAGRAVILRIDLDQERPGGSRERDRTGSITMEPPRVR